MVLSSLTYSVVVSYNQSSLVMKTKRYHVIFDIYNYQKRVSKNFLKKILEELPPVIDMSIIAGPLVVEGAETNPGLSGFVIIDYSHISIHTFSHPKFNEILMDVFSCKPYYVETVTKFLLNRLEIDIPNIKIKKVSWG